MKTHEQMETFRSVDAMFPKPRSKKEFEKTFTVMKAFIWGMFVGSGISSEEIKSLIEQIKNYKTKNNKRTTR